MGFYHYTGHNTQNSQLRYRSTKLGWHLQLVSRYIHRVSGSFPQAHPTQTVAILLRLTEMGSKLGKIRTANLQTAHGPTESNLIPLELRIMAKKLLKHTWIENHAHTLPETRSEKKVWLHRGRKRG